MTAGRQMVEGLEGRVLLSVSGMHLNPIYWHEIRQGEAALPRVAYAGTAGPSAPALSGTTVEAINFDTEASVSGFYSIPPDANIAAGPNHIVDVVNTVIEWRTKDGGNLVRKRLGKNGTTAVGSFFEPLNPVNDLFDPKVIYDQYNGRFIVVAMEKTDTSSGDATNSSRMLVAVSATSDPNGGWYYGAINSEITISRKSRWADYPGLGLDSQAIYLTANMFGFGGGSFAGTRLWIIPKSGFYTGGAMSSAVYDPAGASGLGSTAFTLQPAHMFGTAPTGVGTFLVSSGYGSGSNEELSVIRVSNPLSSPTFANQMVSLGYINSTSSFPDAPQLGSTQGIDAGDQRVYNAVWRDGYLWATNDVMPPTGPDAGQMTAHWYKLSTATLSSIAVADQGNVGGEDLAAGTYTYYPWIMVDAQGDMGLSFAASGPNLYAGAYYTGRMATDAAGTVRPTGTLVAGADSYYRAFGGTANRWGDYSGLALDPADDATFWAFGEYAETRGTVLGGYPSEDGRWGTRFGDFSFLTSISGQLYFDNNANGTMDSGETGRSGLTIFIDSNNNGTLDPGEMQTVTDATGKYTFSGLAAGTYNVVAIINANYVATTPLEQTVTASAGVPVTGVNFGIFTVVYQGGTGPDSYTMRLNATGTRVEISLGSAPLTPPTYSAPVGLVAAGLTFHLGGGGDLLLIDLSNGNPIPAGGISYNAGSDGSFTVNGAAGSGNDFAITGGGATVGGRLVALTGMTQVTFNGGAGNDTLDFNGPVTPAVTFNGGTGADTLNVNSGTFAFAADAKVGTASLSVNVNSASVLFGASQHLAALNLASGAQASLAGGGNKVLVVGSLAIAATARLDLADNTMVLDYTGASPIDTVRQYLLSGRNGGGWDGFGIASTAAQTNRARALGYAEAAALGVTAVNGEAVDSTAVIVKYTWAGDANLDGKVNGDDYALADRGLAKGLKGWVNGDFNYDNVIDASDMELLDAGFAGQTP